MGDLLTNGFEQSDSLTADLNIDYMAIMVAKDIQNGKAPLLSFMKHYKEIEDNKIETWKEFFKGGY